MIYSLGCPLLEESQGSVVGSEYNFIRRTLIAYLLVISLLSPLIG